MWATTVTNPDGTYSGAIIVMMNDRRVLYVGASSHKDEDRAFLFANVVLETLKKALSDILALSSFNEKDKPPADSKVTLEDGEFYWVNAPDVSGDDPIMIGQYFLAPNMWRGFGWYIMGNRYNADVATAIAHIIKPVVNDILLRS